MSRNGSGTYTLPAGQPVVTGTVIDSTVHNAFAADVAAALTASLAKDGQTVPSANIPMGTFKITGLGDATLATDAMNRQASDVRYAQLAASASFTGPFIQLSTANPIIYLNETGVAADTGLWSIDVNAGVWTFRTRNDLNSGGNTWLSIARTATTVDSIAFSATAITLNGVNITDYARLSQSNTFAGAVTITGQLNYISGVAGFMEVVNRSAGALGLRIYHGAAGTAPISEFTAAGGLTLPGALSVAGVSVNSAAILTSGTLGAVNGSNVTALNATQLTTGTVPDARFPATLPAVSAANLTSIPGANITGTIAAVSGVNLTNLNASNLASGTIPSARVTTIDAACTINSSTVGYRGVPRSTTATTLAIGDVGKCVAITATINIPISVFAAGDAVTIYNDSAGALNLTISAGTLRLAGTATTGTRSILQRGFCTIWFNTGGATPDVIASGNVT